MSDYERNKGKMIPFEMTEEVAKEFVLNKREELSAHYKSYLEQLSDDPGYYTDYSLERMGNKFYKIEWEVEGASDVPDFAEVSVNSDGSINFHTYHYNGGAHWTEVVERALKK